LADRDALFAEHHHKLFRYFCRAVGDAEAARDLTQELFLRVTRSAVPVASNGNLAPWLFSIARNLVVDHHRRRQRNPVEQPLGAGDARSRPSSQDVEAAVNEALASLPELDRDVFLMRELGGLGYEDIARACALTPDAVRSRIHRARLHLRDKLAAPLATQRTIPLRRSGYPREGHS
jgi:RNA polymerase sigma-70 factor (ECF subfamily)